MKHYHENRTFNAIQTANVKHVSERANQQAFVGIKEI